MSYNKYDKWRLKMTEINEKDLKELRKYPKWALIEVIEYYAGIGKIELEDIIIALELWKSTKMIEIKKKKK